MRPPGISAEHQPSDTVPAMGGKLFGLSGLVRHDGLANRLGSLAGGIVDKMHLLPEEPNWEEKVQRVAVILSASRSGSSLIFDAMAESDDIVAPAGEHEPWLSLTHNKWPFTRSDQIDTINDRSRLLSLIRNDLLIRQASVSGNEYADLLWNRAVVRQVDQRPGAQRAIGRLGRLASVDATVHNRFNVWLHSLSVTQSPLTDLAQTDRSSFVPIENPPLIDQPLARRATLEEIGSKTLLFKSPADAYRPGFYEALFPEAHITYVHLTRGFAQTVNGLMDGWMQNDIDFISNPVGVGGAPLSIAGYSAPGPREAYWCFDLFPGWEAFTDASLLEVCVQQWLQAHKAIISDFRPMQQITFESLYTDPEALRINLARAAGIRLGNINRSKEVMSTEKPQPYRWLKRGDVLRNVGKYVSKQTFKNVQEMQARLGYSMEESTWH
jgi:hypothetical protein